MSGGREEPLQILRRDHRPVREGMIVRHGADGKLHPAREEAPFELALCA